MSEQSKNVKYGVVFASEIFLKIIFYLSSQLLDFFLSLYGRPKDLNDPLL